MQFCSKRGFPAQRQHRPRVSFFSPFSKGFYYVRQGIQGRLGEAGKAGDVMLIQ